MMILRGLGVCCILALSACSLVSESEVSVYRPFETHALQAHGRWAFSGRLAVADERESFSASVNWRHLGGRDDIELLGPLAQGRLAISVVDGAVTIDDGENRQEFYGSAEQVLSERLGVVMPVDSLRYWVFGILDPGLQGVELDAGFMQAGWRVTFRDVYKVASDSLPKKINIEKDRTKIKLIVDQWDLS
ncbi:lipoprotein insertase outer membrane protein LolB [Methylomonas sp. EFPC3]|uniref:lipoprotein insertase outer membrane protein LolB n=1 Tax=Methylomonas TaxID=416 RepID=UPI00112DA549|nr:MULTISPECIES: lipoprotein insertase outer membrane protein LolB [Methylomonas]TPQ29200.1 outer membrane lipoprotein LolB [Methylomonas koyamae]WFP48654.1 lipoprotein insertase outer membrane protein LolB [Methylomonas sp. EFPC3]